MIVVGSVGSCCCLGCVVGCVIVVLVKVVVPVHWCGSSLCGLSLRQLSLKP